MFLRIDDTPVVRWHLHKYEFSYKLSFVHENAEIEIVKEKKPSSFFPPIPSFVFGPGQDFTRRAKDACMLTPVEVNPNMCRSRAQYKLATQYSKATRYILEKGEILRFHQSQTSALQDLHQKHSLMDGYLSDPHCKTTEASLAFALGPGLPVFLTVSSVIESETPLTIGTIIERSLHVDGEIWIKWSVAGEAYKGGRGWHKGTPWHLMSHLKHQFGFDFFFDPSNSSFLLYHTLVPTDEQRATINWTPEEHKIFRSSHDAAY